jgi:type III secretory pathway component EscV
MAKFNFLKGLFSASDIILACVVIMIVGLMIVPIPTAVLDVLLVLNMGIGIVVLLIAMYLSQPLDFAAFPSLLLIFTLFRL